MELKLFCILSLSIGLYSNAVFPQQVSESKTTASIYYYDNAKQPTLCYFVNGQPLCGEEGQKAREADRERVKRLRDRIPHIAPGREGFENSRGDLDSLPQGDSPFQDDSPVSHPRNPSANNYKGHVRPNNDKGHVVPPAPIPTTPKPTRPPATRRPCPPPTTLPPPCPRQSTTTTASPCRQKITTPSPCAYQTTEHPDIAEWRRTRHRNSRPSYQNDQNQPQSDLLRNRQAWISASSVNQNNNIQSDQPIQGNSDGWWIPTQRQNILKPSVPSTKTIFRSSRTTENDHQGVPKIPEIVVQKNGVLLSVVSDQAQQQLQQQKRKAVKMSSNRSGYFTKRQHNRRGLQLYRHFQKKINTSKSNSN